MGLHYHDTFCRYTAQLASPRACQCKGLAGNITIEARALVTNGHVSSFLFGDTMVPNIEKDSILLLGIVF